ncbi:MAG: DUF58 domain-containing protein [Candidatus Tectomicrobia bacterium]|nr:DUF58 domain-containing protein [Candidatus Tectomicrobia bacterium]
MQRLSSRSYSYLLLIALALFLSAIFQRIEMVFVAIPMISALAISILTQNIPRYALCHRVSKERLFEGENLTVTIEIRAETELPLVELIDPIPPEVDLFSGSNKALFTLKEGETHIIEYELHCFKRSRFDLGRSFIRIYDPFQLILFEEEVAQLTRCVIYPAISLIQQPISPLHTQVYAGNYVSRVFGDGIEFGNIRPYMRGDTTRRINWKVSSRVGELYVNEYLKERNADIVLLLDTLSNVGDRYLNALDLCARGIASLVYHYLKRKDRVGFIDYGGAVRWVRPQMERRQLYRILERLAEARVSFTYVAKDITLIPKRILPPEALIIAFTPLIDERFLKALYNLVARNFDLIVVNLSPTSVMRRVLPRSALNEAACDLWGLEHQLRVEEIRGWGVPLIEWNVDEPIIRVIHTLRQLRHEASIRR